MYTVYRHKNKLNDKMYFGITSRKPEERWGNNGNNYKSTPHFYSAIQKYGWDNFEHNILYENITKEEACNIEKILIEKYKTQNKETSEIYSSVQECARQLHLYATNVSKVCKGIHNTTGGYHLRYYDDMINA